MQKYRLVFETPGEGSGEFDPENRLIRVDPSANRRDLALIHEIGHVIDYDAFPPSGQYASRQSDLLGGWRAAVHKTAAVKRMKHLLKVSQYSVTSPDGRRVNVKVNWRYLEYCLDRAELWACSYAQFIATRTNVSSILVSQVEQETLGIAAQMYPRYWTSDDFGSVSDEIDDVFAKLGWMK